ncbi:hypothetical protein NCCP2495_17480 [Dietzia sp. NCCP-2495]|nr:hypothetical protein NCCP2495_17480 [Dietzia sp. NCCP-2495]
MSVYRGGGPSGCHDTWADDSERLELTEQTAWGLGREPHAHVRPASADRGAPSAPGANEVMEAERFEVGVGHGHIIGVAVRCTCPKTGVLARACGGARRMWK